MTPEAKAKAARDKNTMELFLMLVRNTGVKGIPGASLAPRSPTHYTSPNPTTPPTVTSPEALPAEIMSMIIETIREKNAYDLAAFSQTSRFYKSVVWPMIYDTIEFTADFEQRVARCMPDYRLKSPFMQTKTLVLRHFPNPQYCESLGNEHYLTHRLFPNVKKIIWTPEAIQSFTEEMGLIDHKRWAEPDMTHLPKTWVFELANVQKVDVQVLCPTREQIDRMRIEYERIPHRPYWGAYDMLDEELRRLSTYLSRMEHRSSLRYENLHAGWPNAFVIGREGTFIFSLKGEQPPENPREYPVDFAFFDGSSYSGGLVGPVIVVSMRETRYKYFKNEPSSILNLLDLPLPSTSKIHILNYFKSEAAQDALLYSDITPWGKRVLQILNVGNEDLRSSYRFGMAIRRPMESKDLRMPPDISFNDPQWIIKKD